MRVLIGVSGFGKIKKAEIDITNFTVFVGDNNSGKTYMMQLIYGVLKEMGHVSVELPDYEIEPGKTLIWGEKWLRDYTEAVNRYLCSRKEKIVMDVFHSQIPISQLYVRLECAGEWFEIEVVSKEISDLQEKGNSDHSADVVIKKITTAYIRNRCREISYPIDEMRLEFWYDIDCREVRKYILQQVTKRIFGIPNSRRDSMLYLPASRTGILLLYKYFFSEREAQKAAPYVLHESGSGDINTWGLSSPVYDFLQFLLKYTPNPQSVEKNRSLIQFIEENLIDGRLGEDGDETVYMPQQSDAHIPLYLSSSMVNELTPVVKALKDVRNYRFLFYDEVETCLHPAKQGEMARMLIRLNNSGKRLIISTHSDTMASKINNLLLLSFSDDTKEQREKKLEELKLEEKDLLCSPNVHVYQFINQKDGTSAASELEFRKSPYTGYDFHQFMDSAEDLYEGSLIVLERKE